MFSCLLDAPSKWVAARAHPYDPLDPDPTSVWCDIVGGVDRTVDDLWFIRTDEDDRSPSNEYIYWDHIYP